MPQQSISRHSQKIHYFAQPLHPSSNFLVKPINMVLILGGTFQMGSPETEIDRSNSESPQHQVTVPSFFMSEYPIAAPHWQVVAELMPRVDIDLNPSPSYFKGNGNCPVESVNWFEAVEFCNRLSRHSGRTYRLPTEAEWEYACRAGTTTPFHCGETISTDLANYRGTDDKNLGLSGGYGKGSTGIYRQETTPVGTFPPNAFGLYDMHGNLWEWCLDHWHDNYDGAPTDGSAWVDRRHDINIVRGGSWYDDPRNCRSATRGSYYPVNRIDYIGFRVICEIPRT
jgi:formylglycine-generating enzyme required for sulfatase activity